MYFTITGRHSVNLVQASSHVEQVNIFAWFHSSVALQAETDKAIIYIYIYITDKKKHCLKNIDKPMSPNTSQQSSIKLAIIVKGDLKAPFSIATTLRYWEGSYSIPGITPL